MLLKVRASFIVSAVSAVWREVSAETEFVLVLFGRSRNQAETASQVSFSAVAETETEFRSDSNLRSRFEQGRTGYEGRVQKRKKGEGNQKERRQGWEKMVGYSKSRVPLPSQIPRSALDIALLSVDSS